MSCDGRKSTTDSRCHPQHIEFSLSGAIELHLAAPARHEHDASRPDLPLRRGDASGGRIPHARLDRPIVIKSGRRASPRCDCSRQGAALDPVRDSCAITSWRQHLPEGKRRLATPGRKANAGLQHRAGRQTPVRGDHVSGPRQQSELRSPTTIGFAVPDNDRSCGPRKRSELRSPKTRRARPRVIGVAPRK
jgi:hypothetical protein